MIAEAIDAAVHIAAALLAQGWKTARRALRGRWDVAEVGGEGFPVPTAPDAPQARTAPRWANPTA